MSSSSPTTPSDPPQAPPAGPPAAPTRRRAAITWLLLALWALLIAFAVVGQFEPPWLQAVSRQGKEIEVIDVKNFGDDAFRRGDYRQAITQYEHAHSIDPDDIPVMVNLGTCWVQIGFPERGITILQDALQRTESGISRGLIHYALGYVQEQRGNRDEAIRYYELAAACGTEVFKRTCKLGTLYLAAGDLESAGKAFQRALDAKLDIRRTYLEMLHRAADSFAEDSAALAPIRAQLAAPPSDAEMDRYDLETIRTLQNQDREIAVAHNYLGWVYVRREQFDRAAAHFEKSLAIWPGNRNAVENLSVIHQMQADGVGHPIP